MKSITNLIMAYSIPTIAKTEGKKNHKIFFNKMNISSASLSLSVTKSEAKE